MTYIIIKYFFKEKDDKPSIFELRYHIVEGIDKNGVISTVEPMSILTAKSFKTHQEAEDYLKKHGLMNKTSDCRSHDGLSAFDEMYYKVMDLDSFLERSKQVIESTLNRLNNNTRYGSHDKNI